jgi:lipoyl synthase
MAKLSMGCRNERAYEDKMVAMNDKDVERPVGIKTPAWLVQAVQSAKRGDGSEQVAGTSELLELLGLSTVCVDARCPNRGQCFSHRTATFLILGEVCTRRCRFCAVHHGRPQGPPAADEPERLAQAVYELGLSHVVVTSVTRDDLKDGGSGHYAQVVTALRRRCPGVKVELLIPDFQGSQEALMSVLRSQPDILGHNLETVPRLYPDVRRGADYHLSLNLLHQAKVKAPHVITKSGLMLGLGESGEEIEVVLGDLAQVQCDMLTLGQYLAPSLGHAPVKRYVEREEFDFWREKALEKRFKSVAAGSLVRSSYKASLYFGEMT